MGGPGWVVMGVAKVLAGVLRAFGLTVREAEVLHRVGRLPGPVRG